MLCSANEAEAIILYVCLFSTVDYAVECAHTAIMFNMGQVCTAGSRTFVQEDIYDEFVKRSTARAKSRTVGDPFEPTSESGPQVCSLKNSHLTSPFNLLNQLLDYHLHALKNANLLTVIQS